MRCAFALRIISGIIIYNFGVVVQVLRWS